MSTGKLSFGLNTSKSQQLARRATAPLQLATSAPIAAPIVAVAADGTAIPSEPTPVVGPLVVPLLDSNGRAVDPLAERAAAALLRGEGLATKSAATAGGASAVVPLLVRGRLDGLDSAAGDNDETGTYRRDVALRPDAPSLEAYANMPVEAIGKAMLLGMGWTEGGGVGRKRQVFEPVDLVRRPERLGLGAKVAETEQLPPTHKKRGEDAPASSAATASTSQTRVPAAAADGWQVGARVAVVDGRHKGVSGQIEALPDDKLVALRLASDELVTVKRKYVELSASAAAEPSAASKKRAKSGDDESAKRARKATAIWVRPQIVVRIVSKKYRDAKFYEKKARVLDCVGGELCVVELEDGRVLDDVTQSILENVVGKVGDRVQVLRGERAGALGSVLERDSRKEQVLVQLDADDQPHRFSYDDVAKFGAF